MTACLDCYEYALNYRMFCMSLVYAQIDAAAEEPFFLGFI